MYIKFKKNWIEKIKNLFSFVQIMFMWIIHFNKKWLFMCQKTIPSSPFNVQSYSTNVKYNSWNTYNIKLNFQKVDNT